MGDAMRPRTWPFVRRVVLLPLLLLVAILIALGLNVSSSAASAGPETRVRAFDTTTANAVGQQSSETAGGVGCLRPPDAAIASGSCVATNTADDLAGAASRAASNVGPGSGSVYGTRVHSAFADEIAALGRSDLFSEVSYLNGQVVPYGTPGSVRLDVVVGSPSAPTAIWDLKTGSAALTPGRIAQIQSHLPPGFQTVPVLEVRP
jgi:hypothetical protein